MKSNLCWDDYTLFVRKSTVKLVQKAFFVLFSRFVHARAVGCYVSKPDLVYIFAHESLGKWNLETVLLLVGGGEPLRYKKEAFRVGAKPTIFYRGD